MTLDELAMAAGVSPSHLSRLERSQTLPSFPVLAKIAEALGVNVNDLVQLEQDVARIDAELERYLDVLGMAGEQRTEILRLSIEARRDLVERLRTLASDGLTLVPVQDTIASHLREPGGLPGVAQAEPVICDAGLNGTSYARLLMWLDHLLGHRRVLAGNASLLPLAPGSELLGPFRRVFGWEPLDPAVAGWWQRPHQGSYPRGTAERPLRLILGRRALESAMGHAIAYSLIESLQHPHIEVALTERELGPVNVLVVNGEYAMLERLPPEPASDCGTALWLSGRQRTQALEQLIDDLWDGLPPHEKDHEVVTAAIRRAANRPGD